MNKKIFIWAFAGTTFILPLCAILQVLFVIGVEMAFNISPPVGFVLSGALIVLLLAVVAKLFGRNFNKIKPKSFVKITPVKVTEVKFAK